MGNGSEHKRLGRLAIGAIGAIAVSLTACTGFNPAFGLDETGDSGTSNATGVRTTGATGYGTTGEETADATTQGAGGSSTGSMVQKKVFPATVVECTDSQNNLPPLCEEAAGMGRVTAHRAQPQLGGHEATIFLKIPLPLLDPDAEIVSVELWMYAATDANEAGQLWQTTSFTASTLTMAQPTLLGTDALVQNNSGVNGGDLIVWELPADRLLGDTMYLAVRSGQADSGVVYLKGTGSGDSNAPRLQVEVSE